MNLRMCGGCRRNGLVSDADYEFCLFCETVFPMGIRVQKRSNFHVSNKLIHLRNVLRRLLSKQCSEEVISDLRAMMDRHQIRPEDVDANYVSSFLKDSEMINKKDYKLVFEIINQVKNEKLDLSTEKINEVIEIFKQLVFFCQEITPTKTINYSFFLDKIFEVTGVTRNLRPQTVKNYAKNNSNQLTWENFLAHMRARKRAAQIPEFGHEYVFSPARFAACSLDL
ncbi:late transcription factor VLTF3 [Orf virus]|nr:late transcription factor VLTF3 [Orf virus]WIF30436.1 late transcription factor VLTF3 [Orf virus]